MEMKAAEGKQQRFAVTLVKSASDAERESLSLWLESPLAIRSGDKSPLAKAKAALLATREHKVLWPIVKIISSEIKRNVWDDRSVKSRLGILGVSTGVLFFGGKSAGIAALGGAIGVPLWIVFGAGATFAGFVLEEIARNRAGVSKDVITVDYEEIK